MEQRVLETIRRVRLLVPGDRVAVAVSGGSDSVALLRLLEAVRGELGITLLVVHFDHGLRGEESDADARFAGTLARGRGFDFICEREGVLSAARKHKWNLEDAARRLRYAFFERLVEQGRATRVAVAHTEDDQAETVLAHLLRGTGLTGLAGIYPFVGSIVRPLLSERREDLREYLRTLGQSWREDSTNLDTRRLRARMRSRLLPLLERDFSPQVTKHLAQFAELAREEEAFWDVLVEDRFRKLATRRDETVSMTLQDLLWPLDLARDRAPNHSNLNSLRALTERLIRRLYQEVSGGRQGLAAGHVRQLIHLASESSSGHQVQLPGGVVVERVFSELVFSRRSGARLVGKPGGGEGAYQHLVTLPDHGETTVSVPELKRRFCLKVIDWSLAERDTTKERVALDRDRLSAPLVLRNWRQGDAYRARGHREVEKLKRMFLARHVPRRDRASWPVLESGGRVAWVRGMPPAEEFSAGEGTQVGVVIEEERL
ncbi:MAG TPA: tRNA lysidine(34) synthetase TilS [Candidatus Acidoferrum sp.]|nr:tRNA lysidine(34) synthetase TilS [Candidatus Acidoferrum sp.]